MLQWNVNVLMGPSGRDPVRPEDVAQLILTTNADVVLLQEAGEQRFQEDLESGYSTYYQQPVARLNGRVTRLQSLLREEGYTVVVDDRVSQNPSLLASRLHVVDEGESFSIDEQKYAHATQGDSRSGRLVRVALRRDGSGPQLGFLVTHLHNTERGDSLRGVRRSEATSLLRRWRDTVSGDGSEVVATVLASDLNYPRRRDHRPREWAVVRAGYERLGEPTEGDGVAEVLAGAGFRCAYDLSGAGTPPFTHWTGTTVDFAWLHCRDEARWEVLRSEALPTALSDHLPVVTDLRFT